MDNTELANAQRLRAAGAKPAGPAFRVDTRGVMRFSTGERARAAEIQSTNVSIRRNSPSTAPLWFGWLVAGLVVNAGMGGANNGKEYNAIQGLIAGLGLIGGPIAILVFRNRKGVFVDVEGSGSRITSLPVGDYNPANEAKAYALADDIIHTAQENA